MLEFGITPAVQPPYNQNYRYEYKGKFFLLLILVPWTGSIITSLARTIKGVFQTFWFFRFFPFKFHPLGWRLFAQNLIWDLSYPLGTFAYLAYAILNEVYVVFGSLLRPCFAILRQTTQPFGGDLFPHKPFIEQA